MCNNVEAFLFPEITAEDQKASKLRRFPQAGKLVDITFDQVDDAW